MARPPTKNLRVQISLPHLDPIKNYEKKADFIPELIKVLKINVLKLLFIQIKFGIKETVMNYKCIYS